MANGTSVQDSDEAMDPIDPIDAIESPVELPAQPAPQAPKMVMMNDPSSLAEMLRGKSPEEIAEFERQAAESLESLKAGLAAARAHTSGGRPEISVGAFDSPPVPPPQQAPPPKPEVWEPPPDPHRDPGCPMAKLRPLYYHWTIEAIEKSAYDHPVSPHKLERRYQPIDGLLVSRLNEPGQDPPKMMILLYKKAFVSDSSGKVLQIDPQKMSAGVFVVFHCNHSTRELVPVLKESIARGGRPHVRITPMTWVTLTDGGRELFCEIDVEPDPDDPRKTAIITAESANSRLLEAVR